MVRGRVGQRTSRDKASPPRRTAARHERVWECAFGRTCPSLSYHEVENGSQWSMCRAMACPLNILLDCSDLHRTSWSEMQRDLHVKHKDIIRTSAGTNGSYVLSVFRVYTRVVDGIFFRHSSSLSAPSKLVGAASMHLYYDLGQANCTAKKKRVRFIKCKSIHFFEPYHLSDRKCCC